MAKQDLKVKHSWVVGRCNSEGFHRCHAHFFRHSWSTVFFFPCSRGQIRASERTFIDVFSAFVGPDQARPAREQHRIGLLSVSEINLFGEKDEKSKKYITSPCYL